MGAQTEHGGTFRHQRMKIFNYAFIFAAVAARHCAPTISGSPAVQHVEKAVETIVDKKEKKERKEEKRERKQEKKEKKEKKEKNKGKNKGKKGGKGKNKGKKGKKN